MVVQVVLVVGVASHRRARQETVVLVVQVQMVELVAKGSTELGQMEPLLVMLVPVVWVAQVALQRQAQRGAEELAVILVSLV